MSSFVRANPEDYFRENDVNAVEFARDSTTARTFDVARTFELTPLPQFSEGFMLTIAGIALIAFLALLAFFSREK